MAGRRDETGTGTGAGGAVSDLDQIHRGMGRVEASIDSLTDQCETLMDKLGKVHEEVLEHRGALKVLVSQQATQAAMHGELAGIVHKEIKPSLREIEKLTNQGKGAIFGISLISGGFGAGVASLVAKLFH